MNSGYDTVREKRGNCWVTLLKCIARIVCYHVLLVCSSSVSLSSSAVASMLPCRSGLNLMALSPTAVPGPFETLSLPGDFVVEGAII
jgi:hypothetical protein